MKSKVLTLLPFALGAFLILNGPIYGAQESHEGHSPKESHTDKTGAIVKKDVIFENFRIKVELMTMNAPMEVMKKEMHHEMPMDKHTHGEIVHGPAHENLTHHLIVEVIDSKTDKAVKDAEVDLRLTSPKGEEKSLMLHTMTMKDITHFAGDIDLSQKGNYLFELSISREGIEKKTSFEVMVE
jgi:hypothetical protein